VLPNKLKTVFRKFPSISQNVLMKGKFQSPFSLLTNVWIVAWHWVFWERWSLWSYKVDVSDVFVVKVWLWGVMEKIDFLLHIDSMLLGSNQLLYGFCKSSARLRRGVSLFPTYYCFDGSAY